VTERECVCVLVCLCDRASARERETETETGEGITTRVALSLSLSLSHTHTHTHTHTHSVREAGTETCEGIFDRVVRNKRRIYLLQPAIQKFRGDRNKLPRGRVVLGLGRRETRKKRIDLDSQLQTSTERGSLREIYLSSAESLKCLIFHWGSPPTFQLQSTYIPITFQLHSNYIPITFQLHSNYIPITFQLHNPKPNELPSQRKRVPFYEGLRGGAGGPALQQKNGGGQRPALQRGRARLGDNIGGRCQTLPDSSKECVVKRVLSYRGALSNSS
jgi:hypothetical protein